MSGVLPGSHKMRYDGCDFVILHALVAGTSQWGCICRWCTSASLTAAVITAHEQSLEINAPDDTLAVNGSMDKRTDDSITSPDSVYK